MLNHCVAHGYLDLGDDAALESLACPLPEVARGLTYPGLLSRWVRSNFEGSPFSTCTSTFVRLSITTNGYNYRKSVSLTSSITPIGNARQLWILELAILSTVQTIFA